MAVTPWLRNWFIARRSAVSFPPANDHSAKLSLRRFEDRQVLSVSALLVGTDVTLTGDDGGVSADSIIFTIDNQGYLQHNLGGADGFNSNIDLDNHLVGDQALAVNSITHLQVTLGEGLDSVDFAADFQFSLADVDISAERILASGGSLTVSGATILNAGTTHDITLNGNNDFHILTIISAHSVTIHDSSEIIFAGATSISGDLTVTAQGLITNDATTALDIDNHASFSGDAISLGQVVGDQLNFGTLSFHSTGLVEIIEDSSMRVGSDSSSASLILRSTSDLTLDATLDVNGNSLIATGLNAGSIHVLSPYSSTGNTHLQAFDTLLIDADLEANTLTLEADQRISINASVNATNLTFLGGVLLDGTGTIQGTVTLTTGNTLGGELTVEGAVTINAGAFLSPGNSPGIVATGALNLANSSTLIVEIDDHNTNDPLVTPPGGVAGIDFDQVQVNGTVTIGTNVTLSLQDLGSTAANPRDVYVVIDNDGTADAVTGTFAGLSNGAIVTAINGISYRIFYNGGDGNDVVLIGRPATFTDLFVSNSFSSLTPGAWISDVDFATPGSQPGVFGIDAFATLSDGLAQVDAGGTIHVDQGIYLYTGTLLLNKSVTIDGQGMDLTEIRKSGAATGNFDTAILISANDVTLSNVQIGWQAHSSTISQPSIDYRGYVVVTTADNTTINHVLFGSNATGEGYRSAIVFEGPTGNGADGLEVSDSIFEGRWGRAAIRDGDSGSGENFLITRNEFREDHFRWGPIGIGPQDSAGTPNNFSFSGEISFNYFGNGLDAVDFQSGGNQNYTVTITNQGMTAAGLQILHNTFDWDDSNVVNQNGIYAQPAGVFITPSMTGNADQILIQDNIFNNFAYTGPQPGTGDPLWQTGGRFGGALEFDGVDDFGVFQDPLFDVGTTGTLNFWVQLQDTATRSQFFEGPDNSGFEMQFRPNSPGGQVYGRATTVGGDFVIRSGGDAALLTSDSQWHNIQYTWDFNATNAVGRMHIYIDGVESTYLSGSTPSDLTWASVVSTVDRMMSVGRDPGDSTRYFDGLMDDVGWFNAVLSQAELTNIQNNGVAALSVDSRLVAHWDFDQSTGDVAVDNKNGILMHLSTNGISPLGPTYQAGMGQFGGALEFDGLDDLATFQDPNFDVGAKGSLNFWVNLDNTSVANQFFEGPGNAGFEMQYRTNGGGQVFGRTTTTGGDFVIRSGNDATLLNSGSGWHNIQYTWDFSTGQMRIYVDGNESYLAANNQNLTWASVVDTANGLMSMGYDPGSPGQSLDGMIDDVAWYNDVLTSTELLTIRMTGVTAQSDLVAHWAFDAAPTLENTYTGDSGTDITLYLQQLPPTPPITGYGVVSPVDALVVNNVFFNDAGGEYADSNHSLDASNIFGNDANPFFAGDDPNTPFTGTTLAEFYQLRFGSSAAYQSTEFQADIATAIPHIGASQLDLEPTGTEDILIAGTDFDDLVVITFTSDNDGYFTFTRDATGATPDFVGTFTFVDVTSFRFDAYGGDDVFIIHQPTATQGGLFGLPNGIAFHGGTENNNGNALDSPPDATTGGDTLILLAPISDQATLDSAAYVIDDGSVEGNSGTITLESGALTTVITFTGTEPIRDELRVDHRSFQFATTIGGGGESITLSSPGDTSSMSLIAPFQPEVTVRTFDNQIASTGGPDISFANPFTQLTIHAGSGDDIVTVNSMHVNYRAELVIDGNGDTDAVQLNSNLTLGDLTPGNTGNLTVTSESITVGAGTEITHTMDGEVRFITDRIDISSTSVIDVGAGSVAIHQLTDGLTIDLGSATNPSGGPLSLSDAELNRITSNRLIIGDGNTGSITMSQSISLVNVNTLQLVTGADIVDGNTVGNDLTVANLMLLAEEGIGSSNSLETQVSQLAFRNSSAGSVEIVNSSSLTIAAVGTLDGTTGNEIGNLSGNTTSITALPGLIVAIDTLSVGAMTIAAGEIADAPSFANALSIASGVDVSVTGIGESLTLRARDDVLIGGSVFTAGDLLIESGFGDLDDGGDITDSGFATVLGATSLSAVGNIVLDSLLNDFGTSITITTATNATLDYAHDLVFALVNTTGQLTVDASSVDFSSTATINGNLDIGVTDGDVTDSSGTLLVTGTTVIDASGFDILLDNPANDFREAVTTNAIHVMLNDSNAITLGATTATTSVHVTATDGITLGTGAGEDVTVLGGTVVLNATSGGIFEDAGAIIQTDRLQLLGTGTFSLTEVNDTAILAANIDGSLSYQDTNGLTIGTVDTSGIITSNDDVSITTGGTLDIDEAMELGLGNLLLDVTGQLTTDDLGDTITAHGLALIVSGTSTLNQANNISVLAADNGGVIAYSNVDELAIGELTIDAVTVTGVVTSNDDVTVTTVTGDLSLEQAIQIGAGDLFLIATTGSILDNNDGYTLITAHDLSLNAQTNLGEITDFATGTGNAIDILLSGELTAASVNDADGEIFLCFQGDLTAATGSVNVGGSNTASAILKAVGGDIDVSALDVFSLSSGDNLSLESIRSVGIGGTITLPDAGLDVGTGDLRLHGDEDIVDASGRNLGPLVAADLNITSGSTGGNTTLTTDVNSLTARITGSGSALTVHEANGLTLTDIVTTDGDVTIHASESVAGNITVIDMNAGAARITLIDLANGGGQILDGDSVDSATTSDIAAREIDLQATTGIANGTKLEVAAESLAATTQTGDINVRDVSGDLEIASLARGTEGLSITGGIAGDDICVTSVGALTVSATVTSTGTGTRAILLAADGTVGTNDLTINAHVRTIGGDSPITLLAGDTITFAGTTITAASGTGVVDSRAGRTFNNGGIESSGTSTGNLTMEDGAQIQSDDGTIRLSASDHVQISIVNANTVGSSGDIFLTADADNSGVGSIMEALSGEGSNLVGDVATLQAATGIGGSGTADIDTTLGTLEATNTTSGEIFIHETNGLVIGGTGVQTLSGNGQIHLVVDAGPLTANSIVTAEGAGTVTLIADAGTVDINALVSSTTGDIAVTGNVITQDANFLTGGAGTVTVTADSGSIAMADGTNTSSASGNISYSATGDIALSQLISDDGDLYVTAGSGSSVSGSITDNTASETAHLITSGMATLQAETGIGAASGTSDIDSEVSALRLTNTTNGNIHLTEADAVTLIHLSQSGGGNASVSTTYGSITVDNADALPNAITVNGAGTLLLDANGTMADLIIHDGIQTASGNLILQADQDITTTSAPLTATAGNGSVALYAGHDIRILDPGNLHPVDVSTIGLGTVTLIAANHVTLGSQDPDTTSDVNQHTQLNDVIVQSGTGSITNTLPLLYDTQAPQINSLGEALLTVTIGRPGETNLAIRIFWGDGIIQTFTGLTAGTYTYSHFYTANPNPLDQSAPILVNIQAAHDSRITIHALNVNTPVESVLNGAILVPPPVPVENINTDLSRTIYNSGDSLFSTMQPNVLSAPGSEAAPGNVVFQDTTILATTIPVPGTGLASFPFDTTPPVVALSFPDPPKIIDTLQQTGGQLSGGTLSRIESVQSDDSHTTERLITLEVLSPDGVIRQRVILPETVLDDMLDMIGRLPDGKYRLQLQEPGEERLRLLLEFQVRQGKIADDTEDTDRPPSSAKPKPEEQKETPDEDHMKAPSPTDESTGWLVPQSDSFESDVVQTADIQREESGIPSEQTASNKASARWNGWSSVAARLAWKHGQSRDHHLAPALESSINHSDGSDELPMEPLTASVRGSDWTFLGSTAMFIGTTALLTNCPASEAVYSSAGRPARLSRAAQLFRKYANIRK